MKKLFISAAITLLLFSCTSEETAKRTVEQNLIVGRWKTVSGYMDSGEIAISSCEFSGHTQFYEDGKCANVIGTLNKQGKCQLSSTAGTYTLENDVLTYKSNSYESQSRITDLSEDGFYSTTFFVKDEFGVDNVPKSEQITYRLVTLIE